jgi:FKBP-type peptidyl-prolyl cis-trans isomerase
MFKNKYVVVAGIAVLVLAAAGGGFWLWHGKHTTNSTSQLGQAFDNQQTAAATVGQSSGSNSVPLNQATQTPSNSGGLSVGSSTAAGSIGQLSGQKSGQQGNGSSPSSSSNPVDPSTFAQYDKYKDSQNALMGDIQKGDGTELTAGHKAAVYYKGWLTNGTLFDESRAGSDGKLQPFVFTLGDHQVITGWEQGLSGMKVGGTRLVIVPPVVGYGAAGQGSIPGNSVLVFEVQLAAVQ